jgi:hypothetical protein
VEVHINVNARHRLPRGLSVALLPRLQGDSRRLLGMLRSDDDELPLAPQASLMQLDALVDRFAPRAYPLSSLAKASPQRFRRGSTCFGSGNPQHMTHQTSLMYCPAA